MAFTGETNEDDLEYQQFLAARGKQPGEPGYINSDRMKELSSKFGFNRPARVGLIPTVTDDRKREHELRTTAVATNNPQVRRP